MNKYPKFKITHERSNLNKNDTYFYLYQKDFLFSTWKFIKLKSSVDEVEEEIRKIIQDNNKILLRPMYYNSQGERE